MIYLQAIQNESDRNQVEEIYDKYASTMLYTAQSILKDNFRAEDAVSEAFIRIINNLQKFSFVSSYKTRGLIIIIVKNICYDILKREKYREASFDALENVPGVTGDIPLEHMLTEEDYDRVRACLNNLTGTFKDILRLKYVYEYTNADIAKILEISESNARMRLHRAKLALMQELKKEEVRNG